MRGYVITASNTQVTVCCVLTPCNHVVLTQTFKIDTLLPSSGLQVTHIPFLPSYFPEPSPISSLHPQPHSLRQCQRASYSFKPEDRGRKFLRNVDDIIHHYTVSKLDQNQRSTLETNKWKGMEKCFVMIQWDEISFFVTNTNTQTFRGPCIVSMEVILQQNYGLFENILY